MFEGFIKRENEIFEAIEAFQKLECTLIGGYAVSAYKHRFSVDADIVIKKHDFPEFKKILTRLGFMETISKKLENMYSTEFKRFEKKTGLPVSIDLLLGGMGVRQTGTAISFEKIWENSETRKITGIEKSVRARIPTREMLIVLKLQAGRLTDFRDIVALSEMFDPEKVRGMLEVNNQVKENISRLIALTDDRKFMDSFKGVFMEKRFTPRIDLLKKLSHTFK